MFTYNDLQFTVEKGAKGWDIRRGAALVASSLFPDLAQAEAEAKALELVKIVYPVGVRSVGPDVSHPHTIGDLKIVGPDVGHPNFIYWNKDSVSSAREL
jgi:hypothetical protein